MDDKQERIRQYGEQPDDQATIHEFDMQHTDTQPDNDEDDEPLHMNINPDDFWTFDQTREQLNKRAEQHHPNLQAGDLL